jgi:heme/copper-type cytochrome/quinol oxidase subunit 2
MKGFTMLKGIQIVMLAAMLALAPQLSTGKEEAVVLIPDAGGVQRVTMTVDTHFYKPDHLVVRLGSPVEITLVSQTVLTPHNFVIKEPAAGIDVNKDVPAGESVKVRFTPSQAGVYPFYCDKKLLFFKSHRDKGMEGSLRVEK